MAKQKGNGKTFRKNVVELSKGRNWTEFQTEEFCRILADTANKEVFESIQLKLRKKLEGGDRKTALSKTENRKWILSETEKWPLLKPKTESGYLSETKKCPFKTENRIRSEKRPF